MKTLKLITLCMLLLSASCKDDDDNVAPVDQLPPPTQTGEGTFACLINGEVFTPDRFGQGVPRAFYQNVNFAFTLSISASQRGDVPIMRSINFGGIDVNPIEEGQTYELIEFASGNFFAEYRLGGGLFLNTSPNPSSPGRLTITNFDPENFIISGTFEFTVLDDEGNEIRITEGRFDLRYTT
ncbi:hypothetical protein D7030_06650 [Flavobacteriaceae bacterium AU392]|nr:hypothetical protein D1817_01770 [Flavobacteriaceae bacterium]RKM84809.1 hypothetical protein D7030_06650 [Flavobacteriaceae bacterium AU392]